MNPNATSTAPQMARRTRLVTASAGSRPAVRTVVMSLAVMRRRPRAGLRPSGADADRSSAMPAADAPRYAPLDAAASYGEQPSPRDAARDAPATGRRRYRSIWAR